MKADKILLLAMLAISIWVCMSTAFQAVHTGFAIYGVQTEDDYMEVSYVEMPEDKRMKTALSRGKVVTSIHMPDIADREMYLLAKMIECEARYEPYDGKVAVGVVILNRIRSGRFPDSIESVIFQKGQFQPVVDGGWDNKEPSAASYEAAQDALLGRKPVGENGRSTENALFFIYKDLASETGLQWFEDNLRYITTIGNHDFYSY